jgi:RNA polymerase sigma factor (TIGR02999 family)
MSDVTQILKQIEVGDSMAAGRLMPLVYDELRKLAAARLAAERPDHTLQATALVHEVYLRLVGTEQSWEGRAHFFAAAANSMRQILVNWALAKRCEKRGGTGRKVEMDDLAVAYTTDPDLILELDESLTSLAAEDSVAAELVKLRLFAGLSVTYPVQRLTTTGSSPAPGLRPDDYRRRRNNSRNSPDGFLLFLAL